MMTKYIATIQLKVIVDTHHRKNVKKIIKGNVPYKHVVGTGFDGYEMITDRAIEIIEVK